MKEKKKLSLKGMTLMECIISIAVMAALAMIIVVAGVSAVTNLRIAHSVSEKNAAQSPYASAKIGGNNTGTLNIRLNGAGASGSLNVDTYEIVEHESSDDRVGNYRYFETPVSPAPSAAPTVSPT